MLRRELHAVVPIGVEIGKNGRMNAQRLARAAVLLGLLLLAACATQQHRGDLLKTTLYTYSSAIRWGDFGGAIEFVDPAVRAKKPTTSVDMKRYEQVQVTGYHVQGTREDPDGLVHQTIEMRLVNRHTQVERAVVVREVWRFDAEGKRWWLMSGLPDITESR
jgi:hypothetical protein